MRRSTTRTTARTTALAATLAAGALVLAACSGGTDSAEESPMVGGMTECTTEAVQPAVDEAVAALGGDNAMALDDLQCADGWAVASGVLGPKDAPADGPQGAPTSFVFEQEGQFWIPKDKAAVCGTSADDSEVPADLWTAACAAG